MQKLKSFDQFATEAKISQTRKLEEEKVTKRTNEAETFKALLAEFKVTSIKELTKEQRSQFFNKLRGAELNESLTLIEEGTRGQFGKIDKRGNITSVYTHYDSYPENMLPIIKKSFDKGQNVDDVLAKGDNSGLDTDVDSINFYGGKVRPTTGSITNISKYLKGVADKGGAEFVYLWDEGNKQWLMADLYGNGFDELVPAFESLGVNEAAKFKSTKNFEDFLEEIDGMGDIQIKKIMGKNYIDTPGFYSEEAENYDNDIIEFMTSNMGTKEFEKLQDYWENNVKESVNEAKDDFVARHGKSNILLKKGYKHHTADELEALYDKVGKLVKGLNVKDVNIVFESVNEAEVNSDEEFNEYATTVLQKAFGEEYDEAKAKQVVDGILAKAKGDYGVAVGMLTSSLG